MGESASQLIFEIKIHSEGEKPPKWQHAVRFSHYRKGGVEREDNEKGRQDPDGSSQIEATEIEALAARDLGHELRAYEIAAQHEEEVDAYPSERLYAGEE